jgi:HAE1 family hydrophobic/amphiphilic exporter-1
LISTADYQLVVQGTDLRTLYGPAQDLEARLRQSSMLQDVNTSLELRNPEIQINILRDRAAALGVAGRRLAEERYSWRRVVGRLLEIYGDLAGAAARERAAA